VTIDDKSNALVDAWSGLAAASQTAGSALSFGSARACGVTIAERDIWRADASAIVIAELVEFVSTPDPVLL